MENEKPKMTGTIPAKSQGLKMVAIYCRVSTTHEAQEESLDIQVKTLKQVVANNPKWMLKKSFKMLYSVRLKSHRM